MQRVFLTIKTNIIDLWLFYLWLSWSYLYFRLPRTLHSLFWSMFGLISVDSVEIKYEKKGKLWKWSFNIVGHITIFFKSTLIVGDISTEGCILILWDILMYYLNVGFKMA